ncbi:hypothetical protein [Rheinheimera sp. WS51]|uniref:hypothetical protein n=1 Tax=Rheinheimera sp. WS51 TaxID=3425886 RepID=UPI003D9052E8
MLRKLLQMLKVAPADNKAQAILHLSSASIRFLILPSKHNLSASTIDTITIENNNWQQALTRVLDLLPTYCLLHIALSPDRYQIIQLDKPAVNPDEMLQALPWLVKDLVEIPADDMVVDYLELPEVNAQNPKINVVVSRLSTLKALVEHIDSHGKVISTIQPEEWLLAGQLIESNQSTMLVMHQPGQDLLIQIVRKGVIYFSRRARGFNRLSDITADELQYDVINNLLLELQRSMDYFESQLKQPPVRDIYLVVNQAAVMVEQLKTNGYSRTEPLQFSPLPDNVNKAELTSYWAVLAILPQILAEVSS